MKQRHCCAREYGLISLIGGTLYCMLEILWRGYTHPSMAFAGGLSMACIYHENAQHPKRKPIAKCTMAAMIITCVEFGTGCVVNRLFHWNVWDYSDQRFNLFGQICPLFSAIWFLLSIPALVICSGVRQRFNR